ncbi:hypothetical protein N5D63_21155 [Comamonas thiooxydans]|uniref:Uncharacterized protein n=1 Tax=Comamonas thiooxydans TaxID=363952 RepID=A0AA42Q5S1_9BURK|nr:hypothetical protein [Comamonas thiooxydans]MDH1336659.1 hypothetical protein [Comamonas thiooxydans]
MAREEQGTQLVERHGTTTIAVVTTICRVIDIMGEIGLVSHEQSSGIVQIGEVVTQMH